MPNGWMHASIDLVVYGRTYFDMHKKKDAPYKYLGKAHRQVNHEWYNVFGSEWDLKNPYPKTMVKFLGKLEKSNLSDNEVEGMQSWISHDYMDRIWDTLNHRQRWYREGAYYWLLCHPEFLKKQGVDVINGKIHRVIDGKEIWEYEPVVIKEYRILKAYTDKVFQNQPQEFHEIYCQALDKEHIENCRICQTLNVCQLLKKLGKIYE